MGQFLLGLFLLVVAAPLVFFGQQLARDGWTKITAPPARETESTLKVSDEVAELGRRIDKLSDAVTNSPSIDSKAQLNILKDQHERLAEKEDLTKQEKQTLENQGITLESLEAGRKQDEARLEREKRQTEITKREEEIKQKEAAKKAQVAMEQQQRQAAEERMPIYQFAVQKLYQRLQEVGELSSQTVDTDFPGEYPSLERSNLVKDGKFTPGQHIVRLGSNKEWEFSVTISGTPQPMMGFWLPRFLALTIQAGNSRVIISTPRPMGREPYLLTMFAGSQDQRSNTESSFTEYQKPIDQALKELIQDRYNASPLKPK